MTSNLLTLIKPHKKIFITGTDTEVGKTYCTALIIKYLLKHELYVMPFKPISAGTEYIEELGDKVNEDAYELWLACNKKFSLSQINPIVYDHAIAPHIAAELENKSLNKSLLTKILKESEVEVDVQLIEGAGGWLLPLNNEELMSDWVAEQQLPVIMVVVIKLGCLNHALLTAQAIKASGCKLIGWIANFKDGETQVGRQNLEFIKQKLSAPLFFEVQPNQSEIDDDIDN